MRGAPAGYPEPITRYSQFTAGLSPRQRLRNVLRSGAILGLSSTRSLPHDSSWIRFPYYHHVFDDERAGFAAHLRWMKDLGDVISLDDAVAILESDLPVDGHYFCITFDDGFKNCLTNAVPILVENEVTAAFFVPTGYIGTSIEGDSQLLRYHRPAPNLTVELLTWEECRIMAAAGMTIGSHSVSHARFIDLPDAEVERELRESKEGVERELGVPCHHFCCPTGRPGIDFRVEREPQIARRVGYRSFLTTRRGSTGRKPASMLVERDQLVAGWPTYHLRYFFSR